ncbi:MAG: DegT/DnrJ/EryC1/StrS family aminotransferase [Thermoleophilia bacterium]
MTPPPTEARIFQVASTIGDEEVTAVTEVLRSGWLSEGQRSGRFVDAFLEVVGAPHGVLAPNGTLALMLAATAAGLGPGDEVLVPDTTFYGSATAMCAVGAVPIPVEVDPDFFLLDLEAAEEAITKRTRGIMPVHLYGTSCDMAAVSEFARRHGLVVIEDAAQGVGVTSGEHHVGSISDFGAFSFFADKTITTGEGGFVTCTDSAMFDRLRFIRNQGRINRGSFVHDEFGINYRMTDMQAALGVVQLSRLPDIAKRKQETWGWYSEALDGLSGVRVIGAAPGSNHVPFRCVIMTDRGPAIRRGLEEAGVQVRTGFFPLHAQPGLRAWFDVHGIAIPAGPNGFAASRCHYEDAILLPVHQDVTQGDVDLIADVVRGLVG